MEVNASEVVQVILQYLREHNLNSTADLLQVFTLSLSLEDLMVRRKKRELVIIQRALLKIYAARLTRVLGMWY